MTHTVIGFFRTSDDAYHASDVLHDCGFDYNNIDVSSSYVDIEKQAHDAKTGKVGNFFKSLFSEDNDNVTRFSEYANKNSLVTVHAVDKEEAERVAALLDDCGALNVDETDSDYSEGESITFHDRNKSFADVDFDTERSGLLPSGKYYDNTSEASIQKIEEDVNAGKREIRQGGKRGKSRIIERPVEENLRLREERVKVKKNPAPKRTSMKKNTQSRKLKERQK